MYAGGVLGVLAAEILVLRRRLAVLEATIRQPGTVEEVVFAPLPDAGERSGWGCNREGEAGFRSGRRTGAHAVYPAA